MPLNVPDDIEDSNIDIESPKPVIGTFSFPMNGHVHQDKTCDNDTENDSATFKKVS